jgi:hypothetical protein
VLGFTDIDSHGAAGVESTFDQRLSNPATREYADPVDLEQGQSRRSAWALNTAMTEFSASKRLGAWCWTFTQRSAGDDVAA